MALAWSILQWRNLDWSTTHCKSSSARITRSQRAQGNYEHLQQGIRKPTSPLRFPRLPSFNTSAKQDNLFSPESFCLRNLPTALAVLLFYCLPLNIFQGRKTTARMKHQKQVAWLPKHRPQVHKTWRLQRPPSHRIMPRTRPLSSEC